MVYIHSSLIFSVRHFHDIDILPLKYIALSSTNSYLFITIFIILFIFLYIPGICEPLTSAQCLDKNSWLKCQEEFKCDALKEPGTL